MIKYAENPLWAKGGMICKGLPKGILVSDSKMSTALGDTSVSRFAPTACCDQGL